MLGIAKGKAMRPNLFVALVLTYVIFTSSDVRAGPVTWEFTGEITSLVDVDNLFGGAVGVGTRFSGFFTFESTTPDSEPGSGRGTYTNAITLVGGQVGGFTFGGSSGSSNSITITKFSTHPQIDAYVARAGTNLLGVEETINFSLFLQDFTGVAFPNDSLPLSPPDLSILNEADFRLGLAGSERFNLNGEVMTLVPEPATLGLVGFGVLILGICGRKRNAQLNTGTRE